MTYDKSPTLRKVAKLAMEEEIRPHRRQWVPGCGYCADYKPTDMFPPHDQSKFCEGPSGRTHCACDWCF